MPVCKVCDKQVPKLIGGMCNICMMQSSMEDSRNEVEGQVRYQGMNEFSFDDVANTAKSMGKQIKKYNEKVKKEENKSKLDDYMDFEGEEDVITDEDVYRLLRQMGVSQKGYRAMFNLVKKVYEDYKYEIDDEEYKLILAEDYGKKDGGVVIEKRRGIIVYKDIEYYNEDEEEDTAITFEIEEVEEEPEFIEDIEGDIEDGEDDDIEYEEIENEDGFDDKYDFSND